MMALHRRTPESIANRWIGRALLLALPRVFREVFGNEVLQSLIDDLRDARGAPTRLATLTAKGRAMIDFLAAALGERAATARQRVRRGGRRRASTDDSRWRIRGGAVRNFWYDFRSGKWWRSCAVFQAWRVLGSSIFFPGKVGGKVFHSPGTISRCHPPVRSRPGRAVWCRRDISTPPASRCASDEDSDPAIGQARGRHLADGGDAGGVTGGAWLIENAVASTPGIISRFPR